MAVLSVVLSFAVSSNSIQVLLNLIFASSVSFLFLRSVTSFNFTGNLHSHLV